MVNAKIRPIPEIPFNNWKWTGLCFLTFCSINTVLMLRYPGRNRWRLWWVIRRCSVRKPAHWRRWRKWMCYRVYCFNSIDQRIRKVGEFCSVQYKRFRWLLSAIAPFNNLGLLKGCLLFFRPISPFCHRIHAEFEILTWRNLIKSTVPGLSQ